MISFGFLPFGFILPLIFFVIMVRVASGFLRGVDRRHRVVDEDELAERLRYGGYRPSVPGHPQSDEARIFKLAYRLKGRLTVSDIVVETGLGVHEAEGLIESMVDNSRVRMEVDDRGVVTYEFPEIIRRLEGDA
ncbi:MAG: hypothetical protein ACOCW3_00345 [Spirochaetota bacterium]